MAPLLKSTAVFEIGGNPGGAGDVIAHFGLMPAAPACLPTVWYALAGHGVRDGTWAALRVPALWSFRVSLFAVSGHVAKTLLLDNALETMSVEVLPT